MKNRLVLLGLLFSLASTILVTSCTKEPVRLTFPLSAEIFYTTDDQQVAFTALTHSAVSWDWDFGDGTTSSEENPAHLYEEGGYYKVTLTATDASGNTKSDDVTLALNLTPYAYLTGDYTAEGYDGKTWRISTDHTPLDKLANADLEFTYATDVEELPSNAFGMYLNMGEIYEDEFTFYNDGRYRHDVKGDGAAFGGLLFAYLTGKNMQKTSGELIAGADIFANSDFTPDNEATFIFAENDDYTIASAFGSMGGVLPYPTVTYSGVMTIDFPDSNEFMGVMDFHRKVIVQAINANTMRVVMFMTLDPAAIVSQDPLIPLATTALVLTFEAVN